MNYTHFLTECLQCPCDVGTIVSHVMTRKLRLEEGKPLPRGHMETAGYVRRTWYNSKTSLASTTPRAFYIGHNLLIPAPEMVTTLHGWPQRGSCSAYTPACSLCPSQGSTEEGDQGTLEDRGWRHQVKRNAKPYQLFSQPLQGLPKIQGWLFCCFHLSVVGRYLDADLVIGLKDL